MMSSKNRFNSFLFVRFHLNKCEDVFSDSISAAYPLISLIIIAQMPKKQDVLLCFFMRFIVYFYTRELYTHT